MQEKKGGKEGEASINKKEGETEGKGKETVFLHTVIVLLFAQLLFYGPELYTILQTFPICSPR